MGGKAGRKLAGTDGRERVAVMGLLLALAPAGDGVSLGRLQQGRGPAAQPPRWRRWWCVAAYSTLLCVLAGGRHGASVQARTERNGRH